MATRIFFAFAVGQAMDHQIDLPTPHPIPVAGARERSGKKGRGQNQVLRSQVWPKLPGGPPTLDERAQNGADFRLDLAGRRGEDRWTAMKREHEALAVPQRCEEEQPNTFQGRSGMSGSGPRIVQRKPERAMNERAEQFLPGGKVTIHRPDTNPCTFGDLRHWYRLSIATDQFDRGIEHPLAIAQRVLAEWARGGVRHAGSVPRPLATRACSRYCWTKRTKSSVYRIYAEEFP